jgi:threonine dehydrogenase-like Zn-dependent dehydrogenase
MEPGITCRQCSYCKAGRYNLCPHVAFGSTPPTDGYLMNYKIHQADLCYKYWLCNFIYTAVKYSGLLH